MGDDAGEYLDALEKRLFNTWTRRCRSACTRGRSGGRFDLDGVPAAAAQEGLPGLLHQARHVRRLRSDRQRARLDVPRIQQVADQAAHLIGLLVNDLKKLEHLGGVVGLATFALGCATVYESSLSALWG